MGESALDRVAAKWPSIDRALYPLFTMACVLYAATAFYASMHAQTRGEWSAPLDDVFIHFDYARATARGYPFHWSEGNGFSSGNTSVAYPFVLAFGYWIGFRGALLMLWAAIVAVLTTFGFLIACGKLADPLGRWAKYLIPPVVLSLGALNWSLWSGMENAFHLGVWGMCLAATLSVERASEGEAADRSSARSRAWLTGLACALLVMTRPESVVCVIVFASAVAYFTTKGFGLFEGVRSVVRVGLPGIVALAAQSAANRAFTGEWSANGAIAKLAINNPYMTKDEKIDLYTFLFDYVLDRNTEHHFADQKPWGYLVPIVALVPLFSSRTRAAAIMLWVSGAGWLALTALNSQVRWQNERYTMSAVAWCFVLAALGIGLILRRAADDEVIEALEEKWGEVKGAKVALAIASAVRLGAAIWIASTFWKHQLPNVRDQIWFFGRASRNIRDQHIVAGKVLGKLETRRVLVGDAGALLYASDRPGLDIIGLGGYHDLPFARAGVHGLGASIELIERIPPIDRPDTMAIYPSWWGDLPTLFGRRLAGVPVYGNVICGGSEKVIYRADWSALDRYPKPRSATKDEMLVDELDVADLVSEAEHRYVFPRPSMGFVELRVLADPGDPSRDLFDAGRIIPDGQRETARVKAPQKGGRVVVRTAATKSMKVEVLADGRSLGMIQLDRKTGWIERALAIPPGLAPEVELTLIPRGGEWLDCHVWIMESRGSAP